MHLSCKKNLSNPATASMASSGSSCGAMGGGRDSFVWKRPFRNRNQTPPGKEQPILSAEAVASSQAGSRSLAPRISAYTFCFQPRQPRRAKKNGRS